MNFQAVINAEGDLLSRTDPQWLAALARQGFALDGEGEIAQLAAAVPALSRRSSRSRRTAVSCSRNGRPHMAVRRRV